jgi:hypothetical protein
LTRNLPGTPTDARRNLRGMTDTPQNPAAWHPDPFGRHQMRYWDGTQWTEHVSNQGKQSTDPPTGTPTMPQGQQSAAKVQEQVAMVGASAVPAGDGTDLLDQRILVVNQKWKIFEINNEYAVYDQGGAQIGAVRQVGQSAVKKVLRLVSNLDQYMTHSLQVVDASGAVRLALTRPAKIFKSTIVVAGPDGNEIGRVVQDNMIGKIRFRMEAGGQQIGSLNAENWRAWNFSIRDSSDTEVARVTKTWEGLAKTMFTTADNYVVQVHAPLADPLRSLVVASALCVDTALKQDSRGLS